MIKMVTSEISNAQAQREQQEEYKKLEFAMLTFANFVCKDDPDGVIFDMILLAEMEYQRFSEIDSRKMLNDLITEGALIDLGYNRLKMGRLKR